MITTATATSTTRKVKYEDDSDSDESDNFSEKRCGAFEEEKRSFEEENEGADDRNVNVSQKLHEIWCCLSLPINEKDILGKWFAGIYETKRSKRLSIGQLTLKMLGDQFDPMFFPKMYLLKRG